MTLVATTWQSYAERISARFSNAVEAFIDCGRMLIEAKEGLPHGEFMRLFGVGRLPFGDRTARQLMAVARHPVLSNRIHGSVLPPSWRTLYYLTQLPETELPRLIEAGRITPETQRKDVIEMVRVHRESNVIEFVTPETCTVEDLDTLARQGKKFATVYADPPWLYGNQATRAATGNHYEGMTNAEIAKLPIEALAAEDAHLHLWTTNAFLFDAKEIMRAWGFDYKSVFVWVKPQMGIGNYWRVSHEFLLFGLRGKLPFRDRAQMSWLEADRTEHSAKPKKVREIIESVGLAPRLELFGREEAEGWTVWGNEVSRTLFTESAVRL